MTLDKLCWRYGRWPHEAMAVDDQLMSFNWRVLELAASIED